MNEETEGKLLLGIPGGSVLPAIVHLLELPDGSVREVDAQRFPIVPSMGGNERYSPYHIHRIQRVSAVVLCFSALSYNLQLLEDYGTHLFTYSLI